MQAHKMIEIVRALGAQGLIDDELSTYAVPGIEEATKFHFCAEPPQFNNDDMYAIYNNHKLPMPLCFFQLLDFACLLMSEIEGTDLIDVLFFEKAFPPNNKPTWSFLPVRIIFDHKNLTLTAYRTDDKTKEYYNEIINTPKHIGLINLIYRHIAVMNCSNVVCVDNPPDEKLNKKRIKSNKIPLFSYKTLHIKTGEKYRQIGRITKHGDRVGPRLHLRRGHIRRLASDKTTWVSSCVVGDEKNGIVMKNYKVTA